MGTSIQLGVTLSVAEPVGESRPKLSKAIELEEHVPSLHWVQLGTAQLSAPKLGEAEAERSFKKALEIDPNNAQAHYQLGKLYLQERDFVKAEQYLEKAISLDPSLFRAYYQYGLACLRNGKTEKGKEMLETFNRKRALRTTPAWRECKPNPCQRRSYSDDYAEALCMADCRFSFSIGFRSCHFGSQISIGSKLS